MSNLENETPAAPGARRLSEALHALTASLYTVRARELYEDDPFVSDVGYARFMAEADELDRAARANAAVLEEWEERARELEDPEL